MPGKVKVGLVGLGHNGIAHLEAHLRFEGSEVIALCDLNPARLQAAGRQYGIKKLYADEGIFEDPEVEAISIHTGDNDHRIPFLMALETGKHVLIEKPLANTEDDVLAMVEAVRKSDRRLKIQVGYILRFNPVFEEIHRLARQGGLGDVYYMEGDYIHNLVYQRNQVDSVTGRNWYLEHERPMVGGGSHPLDLLRWISGKEIVQVTGYANHAAFPEMKHDDCQVALFQFADGTIAKVASLYAPRMERPPFCNLRVYGTKGTVDRDRVAQAQSEDEVHPAWRPVETDRVSGHPYDPEVQDWINAILQNRSPRIEFHDGANSTIAALCACRAIARGTCVQVPCFKQR